MLKVLAMNRGGNEEISWAKKLMHWIERRKGKHGHGDREYRVM